MGRGGNSRGGISTGIHLPSRLDPMLSNHGARVIANQFRLQHASLIPPSRPKSSSQHGTFNWLRNKFAKADSSPLKRFGMTNVKVLAVRKTSAVLKFAHCSRSLG